MGNFRVNNRLRGNRYPVGFFVVVAEQPDNRLYFALIDSRIGFNNRCVGSCIQKYGHNLLIPKISLLSFVRTFFVTCVFLNSSTLFIHRKMRAILFSHQSESVDSPLNFYAWSCSTPLKEPCIGIAQRPHPLFRLYQKNSFVLFHLGDLVR